jgi:hypothetical protein
MEHPAVSTTSRCSGVSFRNDATQWPSPWQRGSPRRYVSQDRGRLFIGKSEGWVHKYSVRLIERLVRRHQPERRAHTHAAADCGFARRV